VQGLECSWANLFEDVPKHLDPIIMRQKSVFRQSEVYRHEMRWRPGQPLEKPALVGKCLPERMRQSCMNFVIRASSIRIWHWMPSADRVKPVQARLRRDNWPVRVSAASRTHKVKHRLLNRIRHLHDDQQEVRLAFTPSYVLCRIVAGLSETAGIKKPEQGDLWRHVVECGRSRARFKSLSNLCVWIARQSCDDRGLSCPRLA